MKKYIVGYSVVGCFWLVVFAVAILLRANEDISHRFWFADISFGFLITSVVIALIIGSYEAVRIIADELS